MNDESIKNDKLSGKASCMYISIFMWGGNERIKCLSISTIKLFFFFLKLFIMLCYIEDIFGALFFKEKVNFYLTLSFLLSTVSVGTKENVGSE